jgi:hypothetical protein
VTKILIQPIANLVVQAQRVAHHTLLNVLKDIPHLELQPAYKGNGMHPHVSQILVRKIFQLYMVNLGVQIHKAARSTYSSALVGTLHLLPLCVKWVNGILLFVKRVLAPKHFRHPMVLMVVQELLVGQNISFLALMVIHHLVLQNVNWAIGVNQFVLQTLVSQIL